MKKIKILLFALVALGGFLVWQRKKVLPYLEKAKMLLKSKFGKNSGSNGSSKILGIQNKNPLNIRSTVDNWLGKIGENKGFCVFSSPEYGIRAAMKILISYRKRGIVKVKDIVATWAPPHENDTANYIGYVCKKMNCTPDHVVERNEMAYIQLLTHMSMMESGFLITETVGAKSWHLL